ncbi:MAG: anhydro-N-acetylmuramic acid kinase [Fimbriimonadales bacterium]|nr:anhydro-N-acetylmuramic acid kinase [Fimbriimonadales bacterium]GBC90492.1 Anhydro-N-acetylmuramic acid kinase [bacterium HR14]CUU33765.1 anhydro-N-acetylmuramic acid kinase [Armatimonadetes bacterium GXS]
MSADCVEWLSYLRTKSPRYAIGLMAGTSLDGVDGALVAIEGQKGHRAVRTLATHHIPYSHEEREGLLRLIESGTLADLCAWDAYLGEKFAEVALKLMQKAEAPVAFIGSHGQTVWHAPSAQLFGRPTPNTLQIAQPEVIMARTGVPVVADFRTRDVALGGQGAPLVPFVDWLLLRSDAEPRAALNIGGMANLTYLPPQATPESILAFDTGPGNALIDLAVRWHTGGRLAYDPDGSLAAQASPDEPLLHEMLAHPFFQQPPPKSTGREVFGVEYLQKWWGRVEPLTLIATLTELTARTIAQAVRQWCMPVARLIVSGGGMHNQTLMARLQALLPEVAIQSSATFGIDPDFKEAIAFAVLADCYLMGEPVAFPNTTGVSRPVRLGRLCWG